AGYRCAENQPERRANRQRLSVDDGCHRGSFPNRSTRNGAAVSHRRQHLTPNYSQINSIANGSSAISCSLLVFTSVQFSSALPPNNGIVMIAYHVLHTRHSRIQRSRSPERIWN